MSYFDIIRRNKREAVREREKRQIESGEAGVETDVIKSYYHPNKSIDLNKLTQKKVICNEIGK